MCASVQQVIRPDVKLVSQSKDTVFTTLCSYAKKHILTTWHFLPK